MLQTYNQNISSSFSNEQIISLLQNLPKKNRKSIFSFFINDLVEIVNSSIVPVSLEEYNNRLEESELAIKEGNVKTHAEVKALVEGWKRKRN